MNSLAIPSDFSSSVIVKSNATAVFDTKVGAYQAPFFMVSAGAAVRAFSDANGPAAIRAGRFHAAEAHQLDGRSDGI